MSNKKIKKNTLKSVAKIAKKSSKSSQANSILNIDESNSHKISNQSNVKIYPHADRLLIKEIEKKEIEEKTSFGMILPSQNKESGTARIGEIIAIGSGRMEDGKTIVLPFKVGQKVIFEWGTKIIHEGIEYYLVNQNSVLASFY